MADLTDIQAAQAVKVIGADATGTETNPVNASSLNEQFTADIARNGGIYGTLTLSANNTPVELKVGGSRRANRKLVFWQANDQGIYWGTSSAVSASGGAIGIKFFKDTPFLLPAGDNTEIWFVTGSGAPKTISIAEF